MKTNQTLKKLIFLLIFIPKLAFSQFISSYSELYDSYFFEDRVKKTDLNIRELFLFSKKINEYKLASSFLTESFDVNGYTQILNYYDSLGILRGSMELQTDDKGNKLYLLSKRYSLDKESLIPNSHFKTETRQAENIKIVSEYSFNSKGDTSSSYWIKTYRLSDNKLLKEVRKTSYVTYEYDLAGRLIKTVSSPSDTSVNKYTVENIYNSDGVLIQRRKTSVTKQQSSGQIFNSSSLEDSIELLNNNPQLIKKTRIYNGGLVEKIDGEWIGDIFQITTETKNYPNSTFRRDSFKPHKPESNFFKHEYFAGGQWFISNYNERFPSGLEVRDYYSYNISNGTRDLVFGDKDTTMMVRINNKDVQKRLSYRYSSDTKTWNRTSFQYHNTEWNTDSSMVVFTFDGENEKYGKFIYRKGVITNVTGNKTNASKNMAYPNPSSNGIFHLQRPEKVEVFDCIGNKIYNGVSSTIDLTAKPEGVYILRGEDLETQKLLVNR